MQSSPRAVTPSASKGGYGRSPRTTGGKGRKGRRNPLVEPPSDEDDHVPPPPVASSAELEAALVAGMTPTRHHLTEGPDGEGGGGGGSGGGGGAKAAGPSEEKALLNGAVDAAAADSSGGEPAEELRPEKQMLRTSVVLFVLALFALAATVALAAMQGSFINARNAHHESLSDALCEAAGPRLLRALLAEGTAAEELQLFHRFKDAPAPVTHASAEPSNVSSASYHAARHGFLEAVRHTDEQLEGTLEAWENRLRLITGNVDGAREVHERPHLDVAAFQDAPNAPTTTAVARRRSVAPWASRKGYAFVFRRRAVDGSALPSLSPSRVFEENSLREVRFATTADAGVSRTTPVYASLARSVASLCATDAQLSHTPRLGDASTIAAVASLAVAAHTSTTALATGTVTGPDSGGSVATSAERIAALYDAVGTRSAARSFPTQIPETGVESSSLQKAVPAAVVRTDLPAALADRATLSAAKVAALRNRQAVVAGNLATYLESARAGAPKHTSQNKTALGSLLALWIGVALAAIAFGIGCVGLLHDVSRRDQHVQLGREIQQAEAAMGRMCAALSKVRGLRLSGLSAMRRKVRSNRPEEGALYAALAGFRELELYLPATVAQPPSDAPRSSLNTDGLCVRPYLVPRRRVYALRVDLSAYHRRFSDADSKRQAVHHQLIRFLSTLEDAVRSVAPAAVVQHHGFYVCAWIDLQEPLEFPATSAILAAAEITHRTTETFNTAPNIAVVGADVAFGNVGGLHINAADQHGDDSSDPAAAAAWSSTLPQHRAFKAFTTFGAVNEDADLLAAAAKLHQVPMTCTSSVAQAAHREIEATRSLPSDAEAPPRVASQYVNLRAIEVVTSQEADDLEDGDRAASPSLGGTANAAGFQSPFLQQPLAPANRQVTGAAAGRSPLASLIFEIVVVKVRASNGSAAGTGRAAAVSAQRAVTGDGAGGRARVSEWNRLMQTYCSGNVSRASTELKQYVEAHGADACQSVPRMERLLAVAERAATKSHDAAGQPFVATYMELMRDALVDCA